MIQRRRSGDGNNFQETTVVHREGAPVRKSRLRRPQTASSSGVGGGTAPAGGAVASGTTTTPRQTPATRQAVIRSVSSSGASGSGIASPVSPPYVGANRQSQPQQQKLLSGSAVSSSSTTSAATALNSPHAHNNIIINSNIRRRRKSQMVSSKKKQRTARVAVVTGCGVLFVLWMVVVLAFMKQLEGKDKGKGGTTTMMMQELQHPGNLWSSLRGSAAHGAAAEEGDGEDDGTPPASTTEIVDMRELNSQLPFDNPDGGVWKQGWDVQPLEGKLKVFVVPHSHCDPGWLKTFDQYFKQQVIEIITTVVDALSEDRRRTFIWAEISYFSWWWEEQSEEMRSKAKTLLDNGQFEFVTGGWVQPDEANSELYAMEIQLQEGHDWIRANLGEQYIPKYGWSIDPFGYSPTMAWLLKKYHFRAMLIQRVHYAVKKELAKRKHLEFYWRQTWDNASSKRGNSKKNKRDNDIFTHLMPFFSYDVPHTCGPDPSVCCQFDFHRSPAGDGPGCPWGKPPKLITEKNVKERALLALDQYKKKAALYRSNVVLVPLGDDFRYQKPKEAMLQYTNHQKIHDWINANAPGVEIQFGTLSQYFEAVIGRFEPVPVLKGSFFTYSDVNEDYWSGYFTSRAFDKALDRQLERVLYSAEAFGATKEQVQQPRRELSLFQHHDGITGTAKSFVVDDYAQRMHQAIRFTQNWLLEQLIKSNPQETAVFPDIKPCLVSSIPRSLARNRCVDDDTHGVGRSSSVVVYNPLETAQTCGIVDIPAKQLKVADLPCEVPGPVANSEIQMVFDPITGLMQEPFKEEWKVWNVHAGGAYLFRPGELTSYDPTAYNVVIEDGGYVLKTENWKRTVVQRQVPSEFGTKATVIDFIYEVYVDRDNQEWLVRFSSGVQNGGVFHTDLNGFNFDTHKFRSDMPIQSQVFPMPTFACIEDSQTRFTVLSEHAQGTASLQDGSIDVWLDRRLAQDDNRGLGQGVQDNRPLRTRFRLLLEHEGYDANKAEFTISKLTRRMWTELQHPLEMFGSHKAVVSPADPMKLAEAAARREQIRNKIAARAGHRALNETELKSVSIFSFVGVSRALRRVLKFSRSFFASPKHAPAKRIHTVENTVVPFVYMVYKRVDYLKKAIDSLRRSDFPKTVPLIISHDGRIPAVTDYVESLKSEFNVVQLFHPYSCYDHPRTFPGNDTKLNVGFKGDHYGNPRSSWVTCAKHHFTWILKTVFDDLDLQADIPRGEKSSDDDDNDENQAVDNIGSQFDTFLFTEEDYVVAPSIYSAIVAGLNVMEANEAKADGGFFGLGLDPTEGNTQFEPSWLPNDVWYVTAFRSGPMTMSRKIFQLLKEQATEYCRFDEYNWDWTLVHMQWKRRLPHTLLLPSRTLSKHIGVVDGMHVHDAAEEGDFGGGGYGPDFEKLETRFAGTKLYNGNAKIDRAEHSAGFGGWGHPADQQHCVDLLRRQPDVAP